MFNLRCGIGGALNAYSIAINWLRVGIEVHKIHLSVFYQSTWQLCIA